MIACAERVMLKIDVCTKAFDEHPEIAKSFRIEQRIFNFICFEEFKSNMFYCFDLF